MNRNLAVLLSGLITFSAAGHAAARESAARPNVVILFTDDHGTLDANCYGPTDLITPNIDKLAATGVRLTQAYVHKSCCPSRAALLTGRHPQRTGVDDWTQGASNGSDKAKATMKTFDVGCGSN